MARDAIMRVKKQFGGKRKGYQGKKSSKWDTAKKWGKGAVGTGVSYGVWDLITSILNAVPGKDGGRVTARGIGKAKRGFGKVLRKK